VTSQFCEVCGRPIQEKCVEMEEKGGEKRDESRNTEV